MAIVKETKKKILKSESPMLNVDILMKYGCKKLNIVGCLTWNSNITQIFWLGSNKNDIWKNKEKCIINQQ